MQKLLQTIKLSQFMRFVSRIITLFVSVFMCDLKMNRDGNSFQRVDFSQFIRQLSKR